MESKVDIAREALALLVVYSATPAEPARGFGERGHAGPAGKTGHVWTPAKM